MPPSDKSANNQDKPLAGLIALVTGASSGIGRATALALAENGAKVAINHLKSETAAAASCVIQAVKLGAMAMPIEGDIRSEADVKMMFSAVTAKFGPIDILINNAGIEKGGQIADMTLKDWSAVIDTNLTGQFLCTKEAAAGFKKRYQNAIGKKKDRKKNGDSVDADVDLYGRIIFVSSIYQDLARPGHSNYAASKAGLEMLMKTCALELAEYGVCVNSIAPGMVKTGINENVWKKPGVMAAVLKQIPLKRCAEADEVAKAIIWLCSPEASFMTGSCLTLDGGYSALVGRDSGGIAAKIKQTFERTVWKRDR